MGVSMVVIILVFLMIITIAIGLFLIIRALINYYTKLKKNQSKKE